MLRQFREAGMYIEYDSDGFAERARKLVTSGQTFTIVIRGRAKALLDPHLEDGKAIDPPKLGLMPLLQPLLLILMLADSEEKSVLIEQSEDVVQVVIALGQA